MSRTLYYTLVVSLGGFIFGFDASVISGAIGFIADDFALSAWEQGFVVSSPTLGGILATLTAGAICDAIGRRKTLIIISLLYLVSAIASAFATEYWMLVSARFIGGMAFCSLMIAPIYIAEISTSKNRGKMVSVNQLNIVLGFSVSYFTNYYLLQLSQSDASWISAYGIQENVWRWMLGLEVIPALLWFILLFSVVPSPRWLLMKGKTQQAEEVMQLLFTKEDFMTEVEAIKKSVSSKVEPLLKRVSFLFSKRMRFPILIGLLVGISQQITGINVIFFYAPTIFEQSGVGTNAAFMQAVLIGVVNVIFTIIAMATIDKFGRKPLLTIGLCGVVISLAVCSWGFKQATYSLTESSLVSLSEQQPNSQDHDLSDLSAMSGLVFESDVEFKNAAKAILGEQLFNKHSGDIMKYATTINATLILAGIIGFVASFAMSLGPVMWVMFSEIFPNHVRGIAISLVGVVNSAVSFLVQLVFPWELATLGAATTFFLYGLMAFIGLILVMRYLPETKGKTLEEIELSMSLKRP